MTVRVARVRGEFGFRIHGSRPVVVSAIEPDTPAESSGLRVGDIILTINGVNVLDVPHTEVVRTAQTGRDALELGLARLDEPLEGIGDDHDDERKVGGEEEEEEEVEEEERPAEPAEQQPDLSLVLGRLDDSLRILHSGYLWRLSRSGSLGSVVDAPDETTGAAARATSVGPATARWTRRWFVLRADSCLYFFKTESVSDVALIWYY